MQRLCFDFVTLILILMLKEFTLTQKQRGENDHASWNFWISS
jgi:hypothetical protein